MSIDLQKIEDSPHLLDILLQCEDILDSLDIYVYRNWFDGEVIEGPIVKRHWVSMTLLFPLLKMPDPRAIPRLLKHGARVTFGRVHREPNTHSEEDQFEQLEDNSREATKEQQEKDTFWMITINFPRRLLNQIESAETDGYDDMVDADDVDSGLDAGLDAESAYQADEQRPGSLPEQMPRMGGVDTAIAPPAGTGGANGQF